MAERWVKHLEKGDLIVAVREVGATADDQNLIERVNLEMGTTIAELAYAPDSDSPLLAHYSSLEKARKILVGRGFTRVTLAVVEDDDGDDDSPPRPRAYG